MPAQPTYRAEVIGSLLRPPEVKQAMQDAAEGRLAAAGSVRVNDGCCADAAACHASSSTTVSDRQRVIGGSPITPESRTPPRGTSHSATRRRPRRHGRLAASDGRR